jgi:hypothetical protein
MSATDQLNQSLQTLENQLLQKNQLSKEYKDLVTKSLTDILTLIEGLNKQCRELVASSATPVAMLEEGKNAIAALAASRAKIAELENTLNIRSQQEEATKNQLGKQIEDLKQQSEGHQMSTAELNTRLLAIQATYQTLLTEMDVLKKTNAAISQENAASQQKIQDLTTSLNTAIQSITQIMTKLPDLINQKDISDLQTSVTRIKDILSKTCTKDSIGASTNKSGNANDPRIVLINQLKETYGFNQELVNYLNLQQLTDLTDMVKNNPQRINSYKNMSRDQLIEEIEFVSAVPPPDEESNPRRDSIPPTQPLVQHPTMKSSEKIDKLFSQLDKPPPPPPSQSKKGSKRGGKIKSRKMKPFTNKKKKRTHRRVKRGGYTYSNKKRHYTSSSASSSRKKSSYISSSHPSTATFSGQSQAMV